MNKKLNTLQSPYFTIWFKTKETIEKVLSGEIDFKFHVPILLAGLSIGIGSLENDLGLPLSAVVIILGMFLTFLFFGFFLPLIVMSTGKILNGKSDFNGLQLVFALAQIPVFLVLTLQIANLSFGVIKHPNQVNYLIQLISWLFSMRILIIGIARTQRFSYGFAFFSILLAILPFYILRLFFK